MRRSIFSAASDLEVAKVQLKDYTGSNTRQDTSLDKLSSISLNNILLTHFKHRLNTNFQTKELSLPYKAQHTDYVLRPESLLSSIQLKNKFFAPSTIKRSLIPQYQKILAITYPKSQSDKDDQPTNPTISFAETNMVACKKLLIDCIQTSLLPSLQSLIAINKRLQSFPLCSMNTSVASHPKASAIIINKALPLPNTQPRQMLAITSSSTQTLSLNELLASKLQRFSIIQSIRSNQLFTPSYEKILNEFCRVPQLFIASKPCEILKITNGEPFIPTPVQNSLAIYRGEVNEALPNLYDLLKPSWIDRLKESEQSFLSETSSSDEDTEDFEARTETEELGLSPLSSQESLQTESATGSLRGTQSEDEEDEEELSLDLEEDSFEKSLKESIGKESVKFAQNVELEEEEYQYNLIDELIVEQNDDYERILGFEENTGQKERLLEEVVVVEDNDEDDVIVVDGAHYVEELDFE